jgi:hypothetical protein
MRKMADPKKEMQELSAAEYVFLRWLQDTHPQLYADAEQRQKTIGGFLDSFGQVLESVSQAAPGILKTYVKGQQDLEVLRENLARAKAGEMPLASAGGMMYQPSANPLASVPIWAWALLGLGTVVLLVRK